jgi:hypothetical protein
MKLLAMALVLAKYLVIMVLLAGCGTEEKEEAPATEEVEPDLAPVRTFETTPPDEPEPKVAEELPPVAPEPVIDEPKIVEPVAVVPADKKPTEAEIKETMRLKEAHVMGLVSTLLKGDTFTTMVPEMRALLLAEGGCNISPGYKYTSCTLSEYKGCIGPNGNKYEPTCADNDSPWFYYLSFVFNEKKELLSIYEGKTATYLLSETN